MRRSSLVCLLSVGLLAGCGSAHPRSDQTSGALQPRRLATQGESYLIDLPPEGAAHSMRMAGTPQEIFPHVAEVYQELKIPIETIVTAKFQLGNTSFRARRQIGGISMTRIVDCGHGITGPRANSDMITFNLLTQVKADGPGHVVVETTMTAIARATDGASSNPLNCSSRGELERRIYSGIQERSGR